MDTVDQLTNYAIAGQTPKITFKFPPELTKAVVLTLQKWILLSAFYLLYNDVLGAKEEDDPQSMREERERKKIIRRYYLNTNIVNSYYRYLMSRSFLMKTIRLS